MTKVVVTQAIDIRCADEILGLLGVSMPQPRWHDLAALLARHRTLTPAQAAGPVLLEALKAVEKARMTDAPDDWLHATKLTDRAITQAEGPQA